jgi:amidase
VIDDFLRYWGLVSWMQVGLGRLLLHRGFDRRKIEPWTRGIAGFFARSKLAGLGATMRLRRFGATFRNVMTRYDVLVSPTVAAPALPLGFLATDQPFETHFERVRAFAPFTPLYNASGAPAISLPLGRSRTGLPLGVQFGAAHGRDGLLLELASSLEAATPWELTAPRSRWAHA